MAMLDDAELGKRFDRHRQTDATAPALELVHTTVKLAAAVLNQAVPAGREAALAFTALEDALGWANAAVVRNAGPDWQLPIVDVSELVDDLLEHLEGPLHTRSTPSTRARELEAAERAEIGVIPVEIVRSGVDPEVVRLVRGDCTSWSSLAEMAGPERRCGLVAGHDGPHTRDGVSW